MNSQGYQISDQPGVVATPPSGSFPQPPKLDGIEFDKVRSQLASFYVTRFSDLDEGMVGARFETTPSPQPSLDLL